MKILVCGGRDYRDWTKVCEVLDALQKIYHFKVLISGHAPGADSLGEQWAVNNGLKIITYPPDWNTFGKAAGPIRNQKMLDENPDLTDCVAFPGGRGTDDMINRATIAGLWIHRVTK